MSVTDLEEWTVAPNYVCKRHDVAGRGDTCWLEGCTDVKMPSGNLAELRLELHVAKLNAARWERVADGLLDMVETALDAAVEGPPVCVHRWINGNRALLAYQQAKGGG